MKLMFLLILTFIAILNATIIQAQTHLSLDEAIQIAIKSNPTVLKAEKEIQSAEGKILQAGFIPKLEFGMEFSETPINFNIFNADERNFGFIQSFEFPTKRLIRIKISEYDKKIAEQNFERTKFIVASEVKKNYYKVVYNQKLVKSIESTIESLKDFQRTSTSRYQSGATTYLEVIRAKIEIAKANNELIEAKREAQNSTVGLNLLLGIEPNTTFILTTDLIYTTLKKSLEEILNEYSNKQFSLKISQLFLEQSRMALSLAKKSYLPDFSISLFNQHLAEQPPFDKNNYFGTIDNSWKIEFGISIPVWYWKKQKGEITSAQADFQIAEFNFTKTTRNIHGAIRNAYNIAKSAESQVKIFQETLLSEIEDELKIGITQYQNNQIDALNLIDIYRTYKTIKIEYMKSLYNYQVALADLEVAGEL